MVDLGFDYEADLALGKQDRYESFVRELLKEAQKVDSSYTQKEIVRAYLLQQVLAKSYGWSECGEFWERLVKET
jgi:hypothetical protein